MLDGKILGNIDRSYAAAVVSHLRSVKAAKLALEENLTPGWWGVFLISENEALNLGSIAWLRCCAGRSRFGRS